jgi:hypothetical protein
MPIYVSNKPALRINTTSDMSQFVSQFLFARPVINFKAMDELFKEDVDAHNQVLFNLHLEIKELMIATLFSESKVVNIQDFLAKNSTLLRLMNLQSVHTLLLSITEGHINNADKKHLEEQYSLLYYQIYHILETIRYKLGEKIDLENN